MLAPHEVDVDDTKVVEGKPIPDVNHMNELHGRDGCKQWVGRLDEGKMNTLELVVVDGPVGDEMCAKGKLRVLQKY